MADDGWTPLCSFRKNKPHFKNTQQNIWTRPEPMSPKRTGSAETTRAAKRRHIEEDAESGFISLADYGSESPSSITAEMESEPRNSLEYDAPRDAFISINAETVGSCESNQTATRDRSSVPFSDSERHVPSSLLGKSPSFPSRDGSGGPQQPQPTAQELGNSREPRGTDYQVETPERSPAPAPQNPYANLPAPEIMARLTGYSIRLKKSEDSLKRTTNSAHRRYANSRITRRSSWLAAKGSTNAARRPGSTSFSRLGLIAKNEAAHLTLHRVKYITC
ncbi:hypothetical protein BDZ88DRAFT_195458 [Geranomyces variabilis]|nr:hypothetical protein BDZ88DRAFT_195458 [Geranomyces variabilis]